MPRSGTEGTAGDVREGHDTSHGRPTNARTVAISRLVGACSSFELHAHSRLTQVYKDVSRALRHLHAMGIAHLDVKPENIYLGRRGQDGADGARECYKLGDFGMATRVPLVPGVPLKDGDARYMSPEQFREGLAHPDRADMWALGASLLEVHTGRALPKTGPEYHRLR